MLFRFKVSHKALKTNIKDSSSHLVKSTQIGSHNLKIIRSLCNKSTEDNLHESIIENEILNINLSSHLREAQKRNNQSYLNRSLTSEENEVYHSKTNESLIERGMGEKLLHNLSHSNRRRMLDIYIKLSSRDLWASNQFISIYSSEGKLDKAFRLYKQMKNIPIKPNEDTFHFLLKGCSLEKETNHVEKAMTLLEDMKNLSLQLNTHTFNLALEVCVNAADSKMASHLFEMMQNINIDPNLTTYNNLLLSLKNTNLETIMKFWNNFTKIYEPDLGSFYALYVGFLEIGDYSHINKIFNEMKSKNIVPDNKTILVLLDGAYDFGNQNFSNLIYENVMNDWNSVDFESDVVHSVIKLSSTLSPGHINHVINLIKSKHIDLDEKFFEVAIVSFAKFGDMENTLKYFERARKNMMLSVKSYIGVLLCCLIKKDADRAWICYQSILRSEFDIPDKFLDLLEKVLKQCNRNDLLSILKEDLKNFD